MSLGCDVSHLVLCPEWAGGAHTPSSRAPAGLGNEGSCSWQGRQAVLCSWCVLIHARHSQGSSGHSLSWHWDWWLISAPSTSGGHSAAQSARAALWFCRECTFTGCGWEITGEEWSVCLSVCRAVLHPAGGRGSLSCGLVNVGCLFRNWSAHPASQGQHVSRGPRLGKHKCFRSSKLVK